MSSELSTSHRAGIRGRLLLVAVGLVSALVPLVLALSDALPVQVLGAASGAVSFTGGFGLAHLGWPRRPGSELHRLAVASGFLLCCIGAFLVTAGIGLYH